MAYLNKKAGTLLWLFKISGLFFFVVIHDIECKLVYKFGNYLFHVTSVFVFWFFRRWRRRFSRFVVVAHIFPYCAKVYVCLAFIFPIKIQMQNMQVVLMVVLTLQQHIQFSMVP